MARTPPPRPPRPAPTTRTKPTRGSARPSKADRPPVSRRRKVALIAGVGGLLFMAALVGFAYAATHIPLPAQVGLAQSTIITYSDGTEMARIGPVNRTDVALTEVPLSVRRAVLAAEDRHYYSEPGISIRGIARALVSDVTSGGIKEGGSTITQQYVKNAYLTQERTFSRKLKEIVIAVKLDKKYSKNQVLEWYLNTIYFGRGAYGIEAATQAYFGGHAKDLTVAQGAVLAGLIRNPGYLDPRRNPNDSRTRWHQVLASMVSEKWLTQAQSDAMKYPFVRALGSGIGGGARLRPDIAYLRQAVENELIKNGIKENRITSGDLRITTTIDRKAQQAAETAVETVTVGTPAGLQEALSAIDPATGAIRASYGGKTFSSKDYLDNVFDSKRQPGSSFKPITLATALDKGIALTTKYDGHSPKSIPGTTYVAGKAGPLKNFGNEQFGKIDLVTALADSVNTVFVPLGIDAGLADVVTNAHKLGIPATEDVPVTPAVSLGVGDVRPIDMTSVYASFADRGTEHDPYLVSKVVDHNNNDLYHHEDKATVVFQQPVIDDATTAMQAVVTRGTGTAAGLNARPAAGKTGTTTDNTSAWFCGFTPQLAASVSLFYDDNKKLTNLAGYSEVTGGTLPAKVWKAFMDATLQGEPVMAFAKAANVGVAKSPSPNPTPTVIAHASITPSPSPSPTSTGIVVIPSPSTSPTPTPTPTGLGQQNSPRLRR